MHDDRHLSPAEAAKRLDVSVKALRVYEKRAGQVWQSAFADPKAAPKLPMGPEVFTFMGQAMNKLKERGE